MGVESKPGECFQTGFESKGVARVDHNVREVIEMNDAQLHTLEQLRAFFNGTVAVAVGFSVAANERHSAWSGPCGWTQ